jgi:hypothetical protein
VREVRGRRAVWYQPGGALVVERLYIKEAGKGPASSIAAMLAPPAPLLKGAPATALGNGKEGARGTRSAQTLENRTPAGNRGLRAQEGENVKERLTKLAETGKEGRLAPHPL